MNPFDKKCPDCGARIRFGEFIRVRKPAFNCPACGSSLAGSSLRRIVLGSFLGSFCMSVPMSLGIYDHRWWWGVIPGAVLYAVIALLVMRPESRRPKEVTGV
ncbi:MAG: hypothetical protein IPJ24_04885 [bacterium]|nr:hypothetical protein [bacterium]